ncbi:MAG: DUF819 domain-containing protein, partial [Saprospiraceae bacterium]
MEPFFTNDATVLGLLIIVLAAIFVTSNSDSKGWKKFYTYLPSVLLCYFIPALLHYPFGLIAAKWFSNDLMTLVEASNIDVSLQTLKGMTYEEIVLFLKAQGLTENDYGAYVGSSKLYFMASRYLLPACLVLLCLGIDFKGIINLGPKAIIMFLAATLGIVIGGPIALLVVLYVAPELVSNATPDEIWRGLSTVAGSWIGGGANQTAMKEIFEVQDRIFASMIVVDVVVANIWMGFLLYGANISDRLDRKLKADNSAIEDLKKRVESYSAQMAKIPTTAEVFVMLAFAFGGTALAHWGSDLIVPIMKSFSETLNALRLNSLMSGFFWLIV